MSLFASCRCATLDKRQNPNTQQNVCTNIISVLFLFFFHFSPVYVSCAPFLIKLAIPLNTTAAFVAFIGFIAFVLLNFRTCSCYAVFYGVWSLEYNFTLNRLCIHRNDYSLSEWSHSLNALWNNRSIFFLSSQRNVFRTSRKRLGN